MTRAPSSPVAATRFSRRNVMRAAGVGTAAAGVGAAVAAVSTATAPAARDADGIAGFDLTDLAFDVVDQLRPRDLIGDRFVTLHDRFGAGATAYDVLAPDGRKGTVDRNRGHLEVSGGPHFTLLKSTTGQEAPFAAVVVSVVEFSGDATEDRVYAGLVRGRNSWVLAWYDHADGTVGIDASVDGTVQPLLDAPVEVGELAAPCQIAFALTSTSVVAFVNEGNEGNDESAFRPVAKADLADVVDLRRPEALEVYRNGFGVRSGSGRTELAEVRAGYFGQLGLRDPHLVTHASGKPYIRNNKAYLTFTQAGLGFFETAHWGVWTVDLDTYELTQVANLFFTREGLGVVLGDHAGHIVRDDANDRWIVANSTWGDFAFEGVEINYTTLPTSTDVLHGVHVLRTRRLPLPLGQLTSLHVGQWDPHLVRIGRRWYVGFVNARKFFTFFPALARSPRGADFTELDLVGADYDKVETEGPVMQKLGDRWFLMASNGDNSPAGIQGEYPVYDLRMEQIGTLDAPHPTNIPWPMVFPVPTGNGEVRWVLLTFQGTQFVEELLGYGTHGDIVVMEGHSRTRNPF